MQLRYVWIWVEPLWIFLCKASRNIDCIRTLNNFRSRVISESIHTLLVPNCGQKATLELFVILPSWTVTNQFSHLVLVSVKFPKKSKSSTCLSLYDSIYSYNLYFTAEDRVLHMNKVIFYYWDSNMSCAQTGSNWRSIQMNLFALWWINENQYKVTPKLKYKNNHKCLYGATPQ